MKKAVSRIYYIYFRGLYNRLMNCRKMTSKRILLIHNNALGDTCMAISCLQQIEDSNLKIDVICRADLQYLWNQFFPAADVLPVSEKIWSANLIKENYKPFLNRIYQSVICLSSNSYSIYLATFFPSGGIYAICDHHNIRGSFLLVSDYYRAGKNEHMSVRLIKLIKLAGIAVIDKKWITETAAPVEKVLIHPGAKWAARRWAKEKYLELAEEIAARGFDVIISLHPQEKKLISFFNNAIIHRKIILKITPDIKALFELCRITDLFIGNDSGPAHLANLLQKPVICIWGPGDLNRIAPRGDNVSIIYKEIKCRPCQQYYRFALCRMGSNLCLQEISIAEVLKSFLVKVKRINA